jgi:DnaJ-domain-containing protein 1
VGVIDIPDDSFWGPIYDSMMYVATGQQLPKVDSYAMYALQEDVNQQTNSYLEAVNGVDNLSSGALNNVQGQTAQAFSDHVRGLTGPVPDQVTNAQYMGYQAAQLGLNGEEAEYEGWLVLTFFAAEISAALATGFGAGAVPELILAGRQAFTQVVEKSASRADAIANSLRLAWDTVNTSKGKWWLGREVLQEGTQETVESGLPQVFTSLNHHRQGGADVTSLVASAIAGMAAAMLASAMHGAANQAKWAREFMHTPAGAGLLDYFSEAPIDVAMSAILAAGMDPFGTFISSFLMGSVSKHVHNWSHEQQHQNPGQHGNGHGPTPPPPPNLTPTPDTSLDHLPGDGQHQNLPDDSPVTKIPGGDQKTVPPGSTAGPDGPVGGPDAKPPAVRQAKPATGGQDTKPPVAERGVGTPTSAPDTKSPGAVPDSKTPGAIPAPKVPGGEVGNLPAGGTHQTGVRSDEAPPAYSAAPPHTPPPAYTPGGTQPPPPAVDHQTTPPPAYTPGETQPPPPAVDHQTTQSTATQPSVTQSPVAHSPVPKSPDGQPIATPTPHSPVASAPTPNTQTNVPTPQAVHDIGADKLAPQTPLPTGGPAMSVPRPGISHLGTETANTTPPPATTSTDFPQHPGDQPPALGGATQQAAGTNTTTGQTVRPTTGGTQPSGTNPVQKPKSDGVPQQTPGSGKELPGFETTRAPQTGNTPLEKELPIGDEHAGTRQPPSGQPTSVEAPVTEAPPTGSLSVAAPATHSTTDQHVSPDHQGADGNDQQASDQQTSKVNPYNSYLLADPSMALPPNAVRTARDFESETAGREFLKNNGFEHVLNVNKEIRANTDDTAGLLNCGIASLQLANAIEHRTLFTANDTQAVTLVDLEQVTGNKAIGPFYDKDPITRFLRSPFNNHTQALVARKTGDVGHITLASVDDNGVVNYFDGQRGNFTEVFPIDPSTPFKDLYSNDSGIRFIPLPRGVVFSADFAKPRAKAGNTPTPSVNSQDVSTKPNPSLDDNSNDKALFGADRHRRDRPGRSDRSGRPGQRSRTAVPNAPGRAVLERWASEDPNDPGPIIGGFVPGLGNVEFWAGNLVSAGLPSVDNGPAGVTMTARDEFAALAAWSRSPRRGLVTYRTAPGESAAHALEINRVVNRQQSGFPIEMVAPGAHDFQRHPRGPIEAVFHGGSDGDGFLMHLKAGSVLPNGRRVPAQRKTLPDGREALADPCVYVNGPSAMVALDRSPAFRTAFIERPDVSIRLPACDGASQQGEAFNMTRSAYRDLDYDNDFIFTLKTTIIHYGADPGYVTQRGDFTVESNGGFMRLRRGRGAVPINDPAEDDRYRFTRAEVQAIGRLEGNRYWADITEDQMWSADFNPFPRNRGMFGSSSYDPWAKDAQHAGPTEAPVHVDGSAPAGRQAGDSPTTMPESVIGGKDDFKHTLRNFKFTVVHETGVIGELGSRNSDNENSVGVVATVAATVHDDLTTIAEKYSGGFDGNSADGRFGLVIGMNGTPGSEAAISRKIQQFQNEWDNRFPVAVVGFTWKHPSTDVIDQKTIPYGAIRETIVRNPATENLTTQIRNNGGDNEVYLHIGDADVNSLNTKSGPLFDAVNSTVKNNPEGPPELISGGYNVRPEDGDLAGRAAQLDLEVRQALGDVDSRAVYFPEPNTFVRLDGNRLENDATFGTKNPNTGRFDYGAKEGRGLVDSVLSQRNPSWQYSDHPNAIARFDSGLAIRTDGSRIAGKLGTDPKNVTALTQSHANETTWSDQIGHYLDNHTMLDPNLAKIAGKAAFHGIDPIGPTPNRPGKFSDVAENLSPEDRKALLNGMRQNLEDGKKLADITVATRQALIDNLRNNLAPTTTTEQAAGQRDAEREDSEAGREELRSEPNAGDVVPRDTFTAARRVQLDIHGAEVVRPVVGSRAENARDAILRSLPVDAPRQFGRISGKLDAFGHDEPDVAELATIAEAVGVRVHVLGEDAAWESFGPVGGLPVHLVADTVNGQPRYLAIREDVQIGRVGVGYPGSTTAKSGTKLASHRGEFEVETVAGEHYVRIYTAVVSPAAVGGKYKDVHQSPDGKITVSAGGKQFWAGGGRPLRAVQWIARYAYDGANADRKPVLRSFLVPLDAYLDVTANSRGRKLVDHVDQGADANQFGIRAEGLAIVQEAALDGSLVTYVPEDSAGFDLPELAGRQERLADLHHKLGLPDDFVSTDLGRKNDPWFRWSGKKGEPPSFRNDPEQLSDLARILREHAQTWTGQNSAAPEPHYDRIPETSLKKTDPEVSEATRVKLLNAFLNSYGPPAKNVNQVAEALAGQLNHIVTAEAGRLGPPPVDAARLVEDVGDALRVAFGSAFRDIERLMGRMRVPGDYRGPLPVVRDAHDFAQLIKTQHPGGSFEERVIGPISDSVANTVADDHRFGLLNRTTGAGTPELSGLRDVVRDHVHKTLTDSFGTLADELVASGGDRPHPLENVPKGGGERAGWFSGRRVETVWTDAAATLAGDAEFSARVVQASPGITVEALVPTIAKTVFDSAVNKALGDVKQTDLVGIGPDALREMFGKEVLPKLRQTLEAASEKKPSPLLGTRYWNALAASVTDKWTATADGALRDAEFVAVDPREVEAFMGKVADFATQAEIGAVIASDARRNRLDFTIRTEEQGPFLNEFGAWRANHGSADTLEPFPTEGTPGNRPDVIVRLSGADQAGPAPRQAATLSDSVPESEWWRFYINPKDHEAAIERFLDNPGIYYDWDKSPGFQETMLAAYRDVLDTRSGIDKRVDAAEFERMHRLVTRNFTAEQQAKLRWSDGGVTNHPLSADRRVSPEILDEKVAGRPLVYDMGTHDWSKKQDLDPPPVTIIDRQSFGNATLRTNHGTGETPKLVDAVFDRYYQEIADAGDSTDLKLAAIARAVRALHVLHPFTDANTRLAVQLLLPKLMLQQGFPPVVANGKERLFSGGYSTVEIVRSLQNEVLAGELTAARVQFDRAVRAQDDEEALDRLTNAINAAKKPVGGTPSSDYDGRRGRSEGGWGGGSSSVSGAAGSRSGVVSAESFAGDPAGEAAFRARFFRHLRSVNKPFDGETEEELGGRTTNCLATAVQTLNADRFPERAGEFRAGPSGLVHRDDVPKTGLPGMVRQGRGYDDVIDYVSNKDTDGSHGLVLATFHNERVLSVHKRGDRVVFFDGDREIGLEGLGRPFAVRFSKGVVPGRVRDFRAEPGGFGNVIDYVAGRDTDGAHGVVKAVFSWSHFFSVHKRGGRVVFFDGQKYSIAPRGNPDQVWFSPYDSDRVLKPVYTPVGTTDHIAELPADTRSAAGLRAEGPLGGAPTGHQVLGDSLHKDGNEAGNGRDSGRQEASDRPAHDDPSGWGGGPGDTFFLGLDRAGREVEISPAQVHGLRREGLPHEPVSIVLLPDAGLAGRVYEWKNRIDRRLRVVRTLPGDTRTEALVRSRFRVGGEIDAPFETSLVVAVQPEGGLVAIPVVFPAGGGAVRIEPVRVTKMTAADLISTIPDVQSASSLFLLVPESADPDFARDLARELVLPGLIVNTTAGRTYVSGQGKLVVMGNAGLLRVSASVSSEQTSVRTRDGIRLRPTGRRFITARTEAYESTRFTPVEQVVIEGRERGARESPREWEGPGPRPGNHPGTGRSQTWHDTGSRPGPSASRDARFDPYDVLGVSRNAELNAIERAYARMQLLGLSEDRMRDVRRAFEELTADFYDRFAESEPQESSDGESGGDQDAQLDEGPPDHYATLGVEPHAPEGEIRTQYRKLVMKYHPDRAAREGISPAEATRKSQEINAAYDVLSDEKKRAAYDRQRGRSEGGWGGAGGVVRG